MLNKVSLFILLLAWVLALVIPAQAQTATATACNPGFDIGHLNFGGNCQSNTIDNGMKSDLYRSMATAAYETNKLPEQIKASGPNGGSVVPDTSGAVQLFGYIKWLFSPTSAQETMGKTWAPFLINVYVIFVIVVTMTGIYILINLIVLMMKFTMWIYSWILKLVELVPFVQ